MLRIFAENLLLQTVPGHSDNFCNLHVHMGISILCHDDVDAVDRLASLQASAAAGHCVPGWNADDGSFTCFSSE